MNEILSMLLVIAIICGVTAWIIIMNPMGLGVVITKCFGALYRHREECAYAASMLAPLCGIAYKHIRKKSPKTLIVTKLIMFDFKALRFFSFKSKERRDFD